MAGTLDLPDEREAQIRGLDPGRLLELVRLLCARCEPGALHMLSYFKEGRPTEQEIKSKI